VLQCAESETLAVGSKGVALPCKFRNSATAVLVQMWLATLRNLPYFTSIFFALALKQEGKYVVLMLRYQQIAFL
jgi:hypothetical protein